MRAISAASASEVNGPVAMIQVFSGSRTVISSRRSSIAGSLSMARVTSAANRSRSTVSAWPAGTRVSAAQRSNRESTRRSSSLSSHGAPFSCSLLSELLHTSSASAAVLCAGVATDGRISYSTALPPPRAICQAASQPANPPPITWNSLIAFFVSFTIMDGRR